MLQSITVLYYNVSYSLSVHTQVICRSATYTVIHLECPYSSLQMHQSVLYTIYYCVSFICLNAKRALLLKCVLFLFNVQ